jgi:ferrous iron transport protein A
VIPLSELPCRQSATIQSIAGSDHITQRLFELGLMEGDPIEMIAVAPFGDPLEISSRHGCLSLRRSEAARILVEPIVVGNSSQQQQEGTES